MIVSHLENYSAVGLYNRAGGAPNCLVAKHEAREGVRFFWSTEFDPPRLDRRSFGNHQCPYSRHSAAAQRERLARSRAGWMGVYASRLITRQLQVV